MEQRERSFTVIEGGNQYPLDTTSSKRTEHIKEELCGLEESDLWFLQGYIDGLLGMF